MTDKLKAYRDSLTQEQKDDLLDQARIARQTKAAERDANAHLLKTEYLDSPHWATLASKYKIRMPHQSDKASVKVVRKYLKKADVDVQEWNDAYTSMKYFVENNPRWTAYAVAGLVMEIKNSMENNNV